jgi:Kef-type K+ transport system membrane component KefB
MFLCQDFLTRKCKLIVSVSTRRFCSLILLVVEAGIDIDLSTLKLVGTRGFLIAVVGSLLPICIGMLLAWLMKVGNTTAIIAAGATFGPTSLGIALNILKGGGVLNT